MKSERKSFYYFEVIFSTLVWGAAYPFTKHTVLLVPVIFLVFIRALVSSILMLVWIRPNIRKVLKPDLLAKLFVMSVLGVSLQQYTQAYALTMTSSINAGFLIALTPIIVVLIEIILGSSITYTKIFAFLLGMIGTLIVSYAKGSLNLSAPSTVGDLIFITSSFAWALYVVLTKRWFSNYSQLEITTYTMLISFITLIPFVVKIDFLYEFSKLDTLGWISIFYLCFFSSFLGYLFWNNAVEKLGPVVSSYFIYDEPFASILSAYFITKEKVSLFAFYGGLLIMAGVYLILNEKKIEYERKCST